jgi:hypothetical protein
MEGRRILKCIMGDCTGDRFEKHHSGTVPSVTNISFFSYRETLVLYDTQFSLLHIKHKIES